MLNWLAGSACPFQLVIDARAMAGSFGAVAWGLKHYRTGAPITHVLANHVAGDTHADLCRAALPADIAWAGALPRDPAAALPERHLGLLPAGEIADLESRLDRLAEHLAATAATLPPPVSFAVPTELTFDPPPLLAGQTLAVARDAAFCFLYPANLECLAQLGARVVFFSPLEDRELPPCDAVWLPGGYPKLYAEEIAANASLRHALRTHHAAGKPILAECGGLMACANTLIDLSGRRHAMFGLLPGTVRMQSRLVGLGLLSADLPEGQLRGHTFHYSIIEDAPKPMTRALSSAGRPGEAIWRKRRLTVSYMHFYFPSHPLAAGRLFLP